MTIDPEKRNSERRHHQRVVFNGPAELHTPAGATPVRTRNISVGGLSLLSPLELAPESRCVVRFPIPDTRTGLTNVELQARVVSSMFNKIEDGFMVSLEFVNLSASVAATIARFMQSRSGP